MSMQIIRCVTKMAAVLTASLVLAAAALAGGLNRGETAKMRQPQKCHYPRLAAIDGKPRPGQEALDALTFPLSDWGPLMSWRLFRTHYVAKPLDAFTPFEMPANSSQRTRAELDYLLELQRTRNEAELKWGLQLAAVYYDPTIINTADKRYAQNRDNLFFVGRGLGEWYRRDNLPQTAELLSKVAHDSLVYMVELKLRYARPRPYVLNPSLKVEKAIPHGSFPSGHSLTSYVNAELVSRLAPARRQELMDAAHEMAWSRELLGVHYPSDSEAGRVWAHDFVEFLFESDRFIRDFEAVKAEWTAKRQK